MEKIIDFYISYNSADKQKAIELYDLLKSINASWDIYIGDYDMDNHSEWQEKMYKAVQNSRYLIFVSSNVDFLKQGNGWLFEEVAMFNNLRLLRNTDESTDRNIAAFGILFGKFDLDKELFDDAVRGAEYRTVYGRVCNFVLSDDESISSCAERIKEQVLAIIK